MARKKKKKPLSTWAILIWIVAISAVLTLSLAPIARVIYPLEYEEEIVKYAREYELDCYLVMGIISSESNFDPDARSHKSAHGLMQLKDDTALWCVESLGLDIDSSSIREPEANIHIGCAYMRYLIDLYDGNTITAIAAYNAGLGNVNKWLADKRYSDGKGTLKTIPFSETKTYVEKVQKRAKIYNKLYP